MGYGVIGNTKVSGSFVLGSSPGIPANLHLEVAAPSYSGLVLRPLTAATPVQIRLGSPLGKSLGSSESRLFVFSLFARGLWLCGAAVNLSQRRSLRRGTAGHDGIPRALGIMPATSYGVAFGRIMKSLARSASCPSVTRSHPVGVTTRKKPWFFGIKVFCF